ncbi:MAG: hypothetical protein COC16_02300, partial [Lutibacter sp.]
GLFFITSSLFSQTYKKFIDTGSVKNQFDYLINKSNKYSNYKVVRINWLNQIKSNVSDSLAVSKKEILINYVTINAQKDSIISLTSKIKDSENTINNLNIEKKSISFGGIQFNKGLFKTILFSIIGVLTFLLVLFISKFKRSNIITLQTIATLKEIEGEFDAHRKMALEREQKVMRKLQDELNKQKKE